jgi:hypothetical protein
MFTLRNDGKYFIEVPRTYWGEIFYKVTRGSWHTVECQLSGKDIDNRAFNGDPGDEVLITIERWKDK